MSENTHYEFDKLKEAVEEVFEVDMLSKARDRRNVNARISFSHILHNDRGYSKSCIGRYLNKNHATIIHYCKNFDGYSKTDMMLREGSVRSREIFANTFDPVYTMDRSLLKKEVFSLRKELADLNCEIELSKKESGRMRSIHHIVDERTREGTESDIESKLKTWFNGVYG